jgi:hypothetical protein
MTTYIFQSIESESSNFQSQEKYNIIATTY